jgi:hypothetical protein
MVEGEPTAAGTEGSRPRVILDVRLHRGFFTFVLKNIGSEPALKVVTKIGGKILGPDGKTAINDLNVFRGIEFFAPGREFEILVGSSASYFATDQPTTFTASITYSDESNARYSETITHDLMIYKDMPQMLGP